MAMEGPLSKWTNMLRGWQFRWFVLDGETGVLSYYCSREKMRQDVRRGAIRMFNAVCGIEDEDDCAFTITVDKKTFHLQANDVSERDRWILALQTVIHKHSGYYKPAHSLSHDLHAFDRHVKEAEEYLQLMATHVKEIEQSASSSTNVQGILSSANALMDTVKHAMVVMQTTKSKLAIPRAQPIVSPPPPPKETLTSYSSSDDDELFHDALDSTSPAWTHTRAIDTFGSTSSAQLASSICRSASSSSAASEDEMDEESAVEGLEAPPEFDDDHVDFDALYNTADEKQLTNVQAEHGSVVMHLLSQVSIGMDLTKIVLPTFILERRSLLEMYSDFFAHPDLFVRITEERTPESRMIACVRWYLSSFHAGRRSSVAKKPYNPIIGETFRCHWKVSPPTSTPSSQSSSSSSRRRDDTVSRTGPFPSVDDNQLTFVAEQVSHHPPISAFYAEHPAKRMTCAAHIWTKSKFLGLSIAVHMVGEGCVTLLDHDETYVATFPSAFGRSILTTPWIEMGGKVGVACQKTGYSATINFHTKPFYGGKANTLTAEVLAPGNVKVMTIKGEWNGEMRAVYAKGHTKSTLGDHVFLDVNAIHIIPKQCTPTMQQGDLESRRLWRHVTNALHNNDIQSATRSKHWLEQRQRLQAKQRLDKGNKWTPKCFVEANEVFVYKSPLKGRLPTTPRKQ